MKKNVIQIGDRLAVGISLLCAVHCFLTPILVALLPSVQALSIIDDEAFHSWLLMGVLPTSFLTLVMGCRRHKKYSFFLLGILGLFVLVSAGLWIEEHLGCDYERWATLAGSCIIAIAHANNYRLCRKMDCDLIQDSHGC